MKHGGDLTEAKARHGTGAPDWLDLSTGINPHAWPVPEGLRHVGWERLPGASEMADLLAAARDSYRVPEGAALVAAPGTQALIQWLPHLAPPGAVVIFGPTYGEHEASWRAAGREVGISQRSGVEPVAGNPRDQRLPRPDEEQHGMRHCVLVNPNNPDGRTVGPAELRRLGERASEGGGWLIVDEAFADLGRPRGAASLLPDLPVIVLRSFGKFYGLAGLRLGFAIAAPALAERLRTALGDWPVSGPALAVGAAALADRRWAEGMRGRLAAEATALDGVLAQAGLAPAGGTSLYRLVRHPDAAAIHERLASGHIWCRRFDWAPDLLRFGLPPDAVGLARLRDALARHAHGTSTASPATVAR